MGIAEAEEVKVAGTVRAVRTNRVNLKVPLIL